VFPVPVALFAPERPIGSRADLHTRLQQIDGWGIRGWLQILGLWKLGSAHVSFEPIEGDGDTVACHVAVVDHALGSFAVGSPAADAVCDWALNRAWRELPGDLDMSSYRPNDQVRASNASYLDAGVLCLRMHLRLPMLGMCCDTGRLSAFILRIERFAKNLREKQRRPDLTALIRAVEVQEALRAALPRHGLVAFLGDGARLARDADGRAQRSCRPMRAPQSLRVRIDLGRLGRYTGLGIRAGITALSGAPYHGKSTLLRAIADGIWNHRPGDGRECVVSESSAILVQADEGRGIKNLDVSAFFSVLPHADAHDFSTARASGATSMAASALQGIAAGSRLLLIDEDTAAGNFLSIDPVMRRLLGKSLRGSRTLLEVLPALARQGISTVLVAGAHQQSLAVASQVLLLDHFQVQDATAKARRMLAPAVAGSVRLPERVFADEADCLLGPRHFIAVDAADAERPVVAGQRLDLRRSGWDADEALMRGAICAAAWCCRLTQGRKVSLRELRCLFEEFVKARGARGLDPFDTDFIVVPPWQLVVAVLERLTRPRMKSAFLSRACCDSAVAKRMR
jgi:hypothetical protein